MNNKPTTGAGRCQNHCGHDLKYVRNGFCWANSVMPSIDPGCGHQCIYQPSPRICVRGVDGLEGCGHTEKHLVDCVCRAVRHFCGDGYCESGICGHECNFSPPAKVETHEHNWLPYDPAVGVGYDYCTGCSEIRQPLSPGDAPVHGEVVSEAEFDSRTVDPHVIPEKWLSDVKFFDHIQGVAGVCTWQCAVCFQKWDSSAQLPCPRCRPNWKDELATLSQKVVERAAVICNPPVEPPSRVWMAKHLITNTKLATSFSVPPELQGHCIEYALLAPIQAAVEKCKRGAIRNYERGTVILNSEYWDALVASVREEGNAIQT